MTTKYIPLDKIKLVQVRANTSQEAVAEYSEAMAQQMRESGDGSTRFPPIEALFDGVWYYVFDGTHRTLAKPKADEMVHGTVSEGMILATVENGDEDAAYRRAFKANNGPRPVRITNEDKRNFIRIALQRWPLLSSREIASICGVSATMVCTHREDKPEAVLGADGRITRPAPATAALPATPEESHEDEGESDGPMSREELLAAQANLEAKIEEAKKSGNTELAESLEGNLAVVKATLEEEATPEVAPAKPISLTDLDHLRAALEVLKQEGKEVGDLEALLDRIAVAEKGFIRKCGQDRVSLYAATKAISVEKKSLPESIATIKAINAYWNAYDTFLAKHS